MLPHMLKEYLQTYFPAILLGYLIGCLNLAPGIALTHGKNIYEVGNGNPGASNVTLNFGLKYGILTGSFDVLKAVFSYILTETLFPDVPWVGIIAAAFAVIGHMYPVNRKFKGGKGFASFIGLMLCVNWPAALITLTVALITAIAADYIIAATITCVIALPFYIILAMDNPALGGFVFYISLLIALKHLENLRKIREGTEPRLKENITKRLKRN